MWVSVIWVSLLSLFLCGRMWLCVSLSICLSVCVCFPEGVYVWQANVRGDVWLPWEFIRRLGTLIGFVCLYECECVSVCLFNSLSVSVLVCRSVYGSVLVSVCRTICVCLCICGSFSVWVCGSLSVCFGVSLDVYVWVCGSLSVCLGCVSLYLSICLSLCVCGSLSVCFCYVWVNLHGSSVADRVSFDEARPQFHSLLLSIYQRVLRLECLWENICEIYVKYIWEQK